MRRLEQLVKRRLDNNQGWYTIVAEVPESLGHWQKDFTHPIIRGTWRGMLSSARLSLEDISSPQSSHDKRDSLHRTKQRRPDFSRNNLDCLRLVLAWIVVLFHIQALTADSSFSFLRTFCSPHFAVKSFFVISGLLIFRSYTRSSSFRAYLERRIRRIYPGYFAVITVFAFALCALSGDPWYRYFGLGFWKYLSANLVFLNFAASSLPGVFTANCTSAVNGALWTLKIEVIFYLFVPVLYHLCRRFGTTIVLSAMVGISLLWKYGFLWLAAVHSHVVNVSGDEVRSIYAELAVQFPGQFMYFAAGILILLSFEKLQERFVPIAFISAAAFLIGHLFVEEALDIIWIPGVVFLFGFWHYIGNFSKYGDFSYGVYIVHWPILQILISLGFVKLHPALFLLLSICLVMGASMLLWYAVESRFLRATTHYGHASSLPSA